MSDERLNTTSEIWSEGSTNVQNAPESAREAASIMGVSNTNEPHITPETTDSHSFESRRSDSRLDISKDLSNPDAAPVTPGSATKEQTGIAEGTTGTVAPLPNPSVIVDQAKQHAQKVIEQTQRTAGDAIGQARVRTTSWIETQLDQAADGLNRVAQTVRDTGEQLKAHDHQKMGQIAQFTGSAADAVTGVSTRLRDATVDEIYTETQKVARTQPGLFLGGAFVMGFLLARFLKSTSVNSSSANGATGNGSSNGYGKVNGSSASDGVVDRQLSVPVDGIPAMSASGPNQGR